MFRKLFGLRGAAQPLVVTLPPSDMERINAVKDDEFVDVDALAASLGMDVELHGYREELSGTLQRYGNRWVIGVNRAGSLNRRRFTIAHEIGHYVMHRDLVAMRTGVPGIADDNRYRQPDIPELANPHVLATHESQANQIAILILMSEPKMRRLIEEGLSVEQIAMLIGCSVEATRIRVQGLATTPAAH